MDESKRSLTLFVVVGLLAAGSMLLVDVPTGAPAEEAPASSASVANADPSVLSDAEQRERRLRETRTSIRTPEFEATFTNRNTAMTALRLLEPRYASVPERGRPSRPENLVSTDREEYLPFRQTLSGVRIPRDATWRSEQVDERTVRFTWEGDGFRVVRTVRAGRAKYTLESETTITSLSRGPRPVRVREHVYRYVRHDDEGGGMFGGRSPAVTQGVCEAEGETKLELREELVDARGYGSSVKYAGWGTNYFLAAISPASGNAARCVIGADPILVDDEAVGSVFESQLWHARKVLTPGASVSFRTVIYAGPKDPPSLEAAGHGFVSSVDLGMFGFIAKGMVWLLRAIFSWVHNWGLAIILLTVLVRIGLYPLTAASFKSMAKMRTLKPELDRIQELYGDNQEKKGAAMMALYKTHDINPFAGCLPALAQMPIWLALYTSLSTNVELYHASFLAWRDLSSPDPWFVLPASLALLMYVQQKMTPTTMDPTQAKIMLYMMPVMMGAFMLFLPAGLCVYMLTNSTLGIAQQKFVQWRLDQVPVSAAITTPEPEKQDEPPASTPSAGKKGSKRGRA